MANSINIILATDKNYAQHATVAMASVLLNTYTPKKIYFFVIDDNINADNKEKMLSSVNKLGGRLSFVTANEKALEDVFVSGNLTRAAYLRLDIPNMVPFSVDRIIYIDCDLLVLSDIKQLWETDLNGKPLAATEDFGILSSSAKRAEKIKNLAWKREYSYFNSGVLLIDVKQWRESNNAKKLLKLAVTKSFRHHDQDVLNYLFMNNWVKLEAKWNVIPPIFNMPFRTVIDSALRKRAIAALKAPAILHYAGGYKPWEYESVIGFNDKYYEYLSYTEYCNVKMPQPNPKKKGHSLSRQLWRLKWARFISNIFG
ncbi:MAG: glycosyltransferase family 8 protein [Phascolarctobacterium sp.]|nr:glycosyltransferase family 8 protein [Phascolarctobacterium sp.]